MGEGKIPANDFPPFVVWDQLMRSVFLSLVAVSTLTLTLVRDCYSAENWPAYRGPSADGHSDATNLPVTWSETENVKWKTPIHGKGWSSPVVWGNQIWMCTATEDGVDMSGVCVDTSSGKILHDIRLFHNEEPAFCHATNSYASCTPAIEEGRVYLHFGSYGTTCLDTKTGKEIWTRRDFECDHYRGPGSSPIIYGDLLIVHFDGFDYQYLVALNKHTGQTVWKRDREIDYGTDNGDLMKAYATPVVIEVDGRPQLISPAAKATLAYDPATGEELWRIRYEQHSAATRPLFGHGLVFISTGFSRAELHAVRPTGSGDVTDSHVAWRVEKSIPSMPSQLLIDDLLYMVDDKGVASCIEAKTGDVVWQERIGGNYAASPLYADGRIYLFSREGKTTVFKPGREYKELAVNQLDDGFMASPAVTGNALILRTMTHLYRIEK